MLFADDLAQTWPAAAALVALAMAVLAVGDRVVERVQKWREWQRRQAEEAARRKREEEDAEAQREQAEQDAEAKRRREEAEATFKRETKQESASQRSLRQAWDQIAELNATMIDVNTRFGEVAVQLADHKDQLAECVDDRKRLQTQIDQLKAARGE